MSFLPFPLTVPSSLSPSYKLVITDTRLQSSDLVLPPVVRSLDECILRNKPLVLETGATHVVQRDLLTDIELARLLYAADMALHVSPLSPTTVNSDHECRVQWWRKSRSGRVEGGDGRLFKLQGQLMFSAAESGKQAPLSALPTSTFSLFGSAQQNEQRQVHPQFSGEMLAGFDSDDPDADLEF